MENFTPIPSLFGGILIGIAASYIWLVHGRIAGISGIFHKSVRSLLLKQQLDSTRWRYAFITGLLVSGSVIHALWPETFRVETPTSTLAFVIGGLLVGIGTQIGRGCTSGHGVCGIGRGSTRSIVATIVFMTTAVLTVTVVNYLGGAL